MKTTRLIFLSMILMLHGVSSVNATPGDNQGRIEAMEDVVEGGLRDGAYMLTPFLGIAIGKATYYLYNENPRNWDILFAGNQLVYKKKFG